MSCLFPQEEEEGGIGRLFAAISSTNAATFRRTSAWRHFHSLAILLLTN